jgi:hypothetical protein
MYASNRRQCLRPIVTDQLNCGSRRSSNLIRSSRKILHSFTAQLQLNRNERNMAADVESERRRQGTPPLISPASETFESVAANTQRRNAMKSKSGLKIANGSRIVKLLPVLLAIFHWEPACGQSNSAMNTAGVESDTANADYERPRLAVQLGHSRNVLSVAYARDGRIALTGSDDQTARLWDIVTAKEIRRFEGHSASVQSVAISADSRFAVTGSSDTTARLWNTATGAEVRRFKHATSVTSVAFSPDGKLVLTGSQDGKARLWDVETSDTSRAFEGHVSSITAVAFSPDRKTDADGQRRQYGSTLGRNNRAPAAATGGALRADRFGRVFSRWKAAAHGELRPHGTLLGRSVRHSVATLSSSTPGLCRGLLVRWPAGDHG